MNVFPKALALTLAVGLALASPRSQSSGVMAATEPTQIANNVELVLQYAKQVEGVMTQIQQYKTMLEQLKQLDPSKLAGMLKGAVGGDLMAELQRRLEKAAEIDGSLARLSADMRRLYGEGNNIAQIMQRMQQSGSGPVSLSTILAGMQQLADQRQAGYQQRLDAIQQAMKNSQDEIARVREITDAAPEITGSVQGLQALVQTSGIMSGQLHELSVAMLSQASAQTNAAADQAAKDDAERKRRLQTQCALVTYFGTGDDAAQACSGDAASEPPQTQR